MGIRILGSSCTKYSIVFGGGSGIESALRRCVHTLHIVGADLLLRHASCLDRFRERDFHQVLGGFAGDDRGRAEAPLEGTVWLPHMPSATPTRQYSIGGPDQLVSAV